MSEDFPLRPEITTQTIAELYIKQGYVDKAIDIYEAILELDPGNEAANIKLREIRGDVALPIDEVSTVSKLDTLSGTEGQIFKLEEWLHAIRMA